jgi:hypothetical protein
MELTTQTAAAAARRSNRPVLLLAGLPLLLAFAAAAAGFTYHRISNQLASGTRVGAMTQAQAVAVAQALCARVLPDGARAEVVEAVALTNGAPPGTYPRCNEWQLVCVTRAGRYFVRVNADTGEPVVLRREAGPSAGHENGDLIGGISAREAQRWAHRYGRLAGFPLPAGRNPGIAATKSSSASAGRV